MCQNVIVGQDSKGIWRIPRLLQAMKDACGGDTLRGVVKQTVIRRFPNGRTHTE